MHWRTEELLQRHGPNGLMALSLALVGLLLLQPLSGVPGYAEVEPVRIGSLESGIVASVTVVPGQVLREGDVLGTLDAGPIDDRMRVLSAELAMHQANLLNAEAGAKSMERSARSDRLDAAAHLTGSRTSLQVAAQRLANRQKQVGSGLATQDSLGPMLAEVAMWETEVQQQQVRYDRTSTALDNAVSRAVAGKEGAAPAVLVEVRAQAVVREELALLEQRKQRMTLRSPVAARVIAVHHRVGEVLGPQAPLVELLPLQTTAVAACLPEAFAKHVQPGSSARLHPAAGGEVRMGTVVDLVGLVSEAPERCKQRPNEIGWVRPVRIAVAGEGLVPGQRFDVSFGPPVVGPAP
jgi:HlyD family secretion protein